MHAMLRRTLPLCVLAVISLATRGAPAGAQLIIEYPLPSGGDPVSITAGPDGNLWFTEISENRIGKMTTTGALTEYINAIPSGRPVTITTGPGGLWFTNGTKIRRVTTSGSFSTVYDIPTPFPAAFGITAGPDGNLWFTENWADKIGKLDPNTGIFDEYDIPTTIVACGGTPPTCGGACAPPFVCAAHPTLGCICAPTPTSGGLSGPFEITTGPDGNLWFTERNANKVSYFDPINLVFTQYAIPTANSAPEGITTGPDNNLWFTERVGNKIGRVTLLGAFAEYPIPTANNSAFEITTGPDNNLWFTEPGVNKIGRFNPTTQSFTEFVVPTANSFPQGITAGPDGQVWFTEFGSSKIGTFCTPPVAICGNGVREGDEDCDTGSPNCISCTCPVTGPDSDGDGVPDFCDNCPNAGSANYNPDQRNSDCSSASPAGCTDGGDVCDVCPAAANGCDAALSGGKNITSAGGSLSFGPSIGTTPPNATIMVTVPQGVVCGNTSISVTNNQGASSGGFFTVHPAKIALRPEAMHFSLPVVVKVGWADREPDGIVDVGVCDNASMLSCDHNADCPPPGNCVNSGNLVEADLTLKRSSSTGTGVFTENGFAGSCAGGVCRCDKHDPSISACATAQANCADLAGTGKASVANCCSVLNHQWTFQTCDFSTFDVAEFATDLIAGGGPVTTDCVAEWNVNNPNNRPIDRKGLVSRTQVCTDGEIGCDGDGQANGVCAFRVGVCLNAEDSRLVRHDLPACPVTDVAAWEIRKPHPDSSDPGEAASAVALRDAVAALAPSSIGGSHQEQVVFGPAFATSDVCTPLVSVAVPLHDAGTSPGKATLKSRAHTMTGAKDADVLKLICMPPP